MELPDRKTDVEDQTFFDLEKLGLPDKDQRGPTLWKAYRRRVNQATGLSDPWEDGSGGGWTTQHEHAECLYMILATIRESGSTGLDSFRETEIGDTDGDGMPEILDAWGRPIYFLRWAPGHVSELQDINDLTNRESDPFDPMRIDCQQFRLKMTKRVADFAQGNLQPLRFGNAVAV